MESILPTDVSRDVSAIQALGAVPTILETVSAITGLRFVCIARVTPGSWTSCAVLDKLGFGLKVGDGLDVTTTLCEEVRDTGKPVIIDCVAEDERYRDHHTPRIYGFQSYISIPVFRQNGNYFGTLCGLDPAPANLSNTATVSSMTLFAQLLSLQLDEQEKLDLARRALADERERSELREQFIAVLGHDIRNPLGAIVSGLDLLQMQNTNPRATPVLERLRRSAQRIASMTDDVVDFARGRLGGGIALNIRHETEMNLVLDQVIAELRGVHPQRDIVADLPANLALRCDSGRIAQLLSNLLNNALVHGDPHAPIYVSAHTTYGVFQLAVTNSGPTIPDDVKAQLFKPFWRASQTANKGLGLGLFIVSEIARSHRGEIGVESAHGKTTFTFTSPGVDIAESD